MIEISSGYQLRGRIVLPASKSISARALIINALSRNPSLPDNLSDSDDTQAMLKGLASPKPSPKGEGLKSLPLGGDLEEAGGSFIDIGAAGTAMRFLTAYLSVTPGQHIITGTQRMQHRPIGILVDALRQLGATITYEGEEGFPPLRIVGHDNLEGGSLTVPGNVSSQYISALLMIAPTLKNGLHLTLEGNVASRPYLDMTISMMREFGAKVEWQGNNAIDVQPGSYLQRPYHIESDWSAASYWYEMVALTRDANAEVELVGLHRDSIQGDSKVWQMFRELGVVTEYFVEPDGTEVIRIRKGGGITCHFSCDFTHQPDLAQTFAVTCSMLGVPFHLYGLQSLRIKETDRIDALVNELGKIVRLEEKDSELLWEGFYEIEDLDMLPYETFTFDTYEDHRMAMSLAPVCLRTGGEIQINNPEVVSKSYPSFWEDLKKVGFKVETTPSDSPLKGEKTKQEVSPLRGDLEGSWCCGLHEVCEKESLRAAMEDVEYYEDEELDRFRGRTSYSEEEVEEFREVLYTMRTDEVPGWVHSLELRRVNLPDELKDEVLLIVGEQGQ